MTALATGLVIYLALGALLLVLGLAGDSSRRRGWPPFLGLVFILGWLPLCVWYGLEMLLERQAR